MYLHGYGQPRPNHYFAGNRMIIKEKQDDKASRCLSLVLKRIINEAKSGNSGLIFASTYTLNTRAQNLLRLGLSSFLNTMKGLNPSIISLWLLPPPTHFSRSNYSKQHIQGILDLLNTGAFIRFDHAVHAKFLLFWSISKRKLARHCRYFGSTNFTLGGLVRNIEEFHFDVSSKISNLHAFYFAKAAEYLDGIIRSYRRQDYLSSLRIRLNRKLEVATSEIKAKASDATRPKEKLEAARTGYLHAIKMLTSLWNLPGKRWAYDVTESFLGSFDHSMFELNFLGEISGWPVEEIDMFVNNWQINTDSYLDIAFKLGNFLEKLKSEIRSYFEEGYQAFLFDEEQLFINQLDFKAKPISELKELHWTESWDI